MAVPSQAHVEDVRIVWGVGKIGGDPDPLNCRGGIEVVGYLDQRVPISVTHVRRFAPGDKVSVGGSSADGNDGDDRLYGESGTDTLEGGKGDDRLYGGSGIDWLFGDAGNDTLEGGRGIDNMFGGSGNDTLEGGSGNDGLTGGAGEDSLSGGAGTDVCVGRRGEDTFSDCEIERDEP